VRFLYDGERKEKRILYFRVMEVKAKGVARCNEMYTTSYLSITYTRHCVNIVKILTW